MRADELTQETVHFFAIKHYIDPDCLGVKEYENDVKRFKYVKRLLRKYEKTKILSERLLLNHLILLHNVFGVALLPLLFYKIERSYWPQLKTFLVFLNYLPVHYQVTKDVNELDISLDDDIIKILRKI